MKYLDNLKVAMKVGISSGSILLLLLIASVITITGLMSASSNFSDYRSLALETNAEAETEKNLLSARIDVKDFIQTGSDDALRRVTDRLKATHAAIDASLVLFEDPKVEAKMEALAASLDVYESTFRTIAGIRDERNALVDKMNAVGPQLEKALTGLMDSSRTAGNADAVYEAGTAERTLLLARLYANRFLTDNDPAHIERVNNEISETRATLLKLERALAGAQRGKVSGISEGLADYEAAFSAVSALILKRNGIIANELDATGRQIANDLSALQASARQAQEELGPRQPPASAALSGSVLSPPLPLLLWALAQPL